MKNLMPVLLCPIPVMQANRVSQPTCIRLPAHTGLSKGCAPLNPAITIEPLDLVSVRLPRSLIATLRALADSQSVDGRRITLSDALRSHLALEQVKVLGNQRPRRRSAVLNQVKAQIDPTLMRQLSGIGSNVNQLARAVNLGAIDGNLIQATVLMSAILSVERGITDLTTLLKEQYAH